MAQDCHASTQESEAEELLGVQGQPGICGEYKFSLDNPARNQKPGMEPEMNKGKNLLDFRGQEAFQGV